jgi:hypothetical protein
MKCLQCDNEFEHKRETAKFCSDKCKVKWHRKNPKKGAVAKFELMTLYNEFKAAIQNLSMQDIKIVKSGYFVPPEMGFVETTSNGNPITNKPIYKHQLTEKECYEPEYVTYSDYYNGISKSKTVPEVEKIIALANKNDNISWPERVNLKKHGVEISKDFYTD